MINYKYRKYFFALYLFLIGLSGYSQSNSDTDNDGVLDNKDLCPNTPTGTVVNTYGCPVSKAVCDYSTTSFTFSSTNVPVGSVTKYVLATATDGKIVQLSDTPSFSGLSGTNTYMVLAYSYQNDGSLQNLQVNSFLTQVSSNCSVWSEALIVKVCIPNTTCDFTSSTLNLTSSTPQSGVTTKYILANSSEQILQINDTPTFGGLSGTNTYIAYALSYSGTVSNLNIGSTVSNVTGSCLGWSSGLTLKGCICIPDVCIPVKAVIIK